MRMSAEGRARLSFREGRRLKAYRDTKGVLTIGIGHTSMVGPPQVTPGLVISDAECDVIFARDLAKYEATVNVSVKAVLAQHQFDALVSLCYNIGQSAFAKSTVVRRLNEGDFGGAGEAFLMWNRPPEIVGRRRSERLQFLVPYALLEPLPAPVRIPGPPDVPKPLPRSPAPTPGIWAAFLSIFKRPV